MSKAMTVDELINKLNLIQDKTKKVYYFDSFREDGDQLHSINNVSDTFYDIDDIIILEWED
jgi:hypothetical protein